MTVKDLRELIADMPESSPMEIFNSGYEWYGVAPVVADQIRVVDGRLVINFGGAWSAWDHIGLSEVDEYRMIKQREER